MWWSTPKTLAWLAMDTGRVECLRALVESFNLDVNDYFRCNRVKWPNFICFAALSSKSPAIIECLVSLGAKLEYYGPSSTETTSHDMYRVRRYARDILVWDALIEKVKRWSRDDLMLSTLSCRQHCWLQILIHEIDYTSFFPPIIIHRQKNLWFDKDPWAQGYVIRKRKDLLQQ